MPKNRVWSIIACFVVAAATMVGIAFAAAPPAEQKATPSRLFATDPPKSAPIAKHVAPSPKSRSVENEAASKYVKRLNVEFDSIDQAEAKYDEYFKQHLVYPNVVRAEVRRLFFRAKGKKKSAQELDQIIALMRGAIRNGQVQPWMYEAMGLTMQLKGMPKEEIERALMSAADFTDDPRAKLAMGDYLSRMGYEDRAVDLYRQVGDVHSLRTETFEKVLNLSERIEDGEATEWASLGILRRAARRNELELWKRAYRTAKVRLEELRQEGKQESADQFAKKLSQALRRDLLVIVRWNGDADIDMMVEEPGGTTCSFRNPRTTGGGVMTGDLADTLGRSSGEEHSEMYVCPEGFAGKYRVMLRHVWGRIPSGKVTVDVFGNQGEGKVGHVRRQITMSDRPSMVVFELPEGRRDESLEQHQLVNDIKTQLAINEVASNRALLAQQISTVSSQGRSNGSSLSLDNDDPRFAGRIPPNLAGRDSVGFRPVISLLPEGRTMSVNAVISANRKYVRITALPFFSQVGDVTEFAVGAPGVGTINEDLVNINDIEVDEDGNIIDKDTGCIIIDAEGNVVNEEPPC